MSGFINLEDSPMFQKEVHKLEKIAEHLKDRCQKLFKGCQSYMAAVGEVCKADTSFADSLEAFGAGQDDPVSVSIGGPVLSKFVSVFRELATYQELLRSQVDHVLVDRLMHFMDIDLQDAKESRRRLDKSMHAYDQSREKFVALKKSTPGEIVEELEEDLRNSKSAFEKSRFNLVSSLMQVEAKKKYEFLETISAIMDAHLRYFKLGYDLFLQMEPFIHEVFTYAQQSKELANVEQDKLAKRIQAFRTQAELDSIRASSNIEPFTSADRIHGGGLNCLKITEEIMLSAANGEVQTIKQGYLLKRSGLRDWKRRFFVLDNQGTLLYYTNKSNKPVGIRHRPFSSADHSSGVFARFRARHNRSSSLDEGSLGFQIIDLRTSAIKMDAEDTDLRLCFKIISPLKTYTLQAENGADKMEWVNKILAIIASLLNSNFLQKPPSGRKYLENNVSSSGASSHVRELDSCQHLEDGNEINGGEHVCNILREIPGNDICAECSAPIPDWASLNLGILLCIECSGVHRNLGVHISKVRSLTLDVKVWEPAILDLFRTLGNTYCNSIWEGLLHLENQRVGDSNIIISSVTKPCPKDGFHCKEKYIHAKYVEKLLVTREAGESYNHSHVPNIWEAVKTNNLREVYRCIVVSSVNIINTTFDQAVDSDLHHHVINAQDRQDSQLNSHVGEGDRYDPAACQRIKDSNDPGNCFQGCSLLHLACHNDNTVMLELLLQFGADPNLQDFHGRTPLHYCISRGNHALAKFLLRRGASPMVRDGGGLSVLERAMDMGAITDEELFLLLAESR